MYSRIKFQKIDKKENTEEDDEGRNGKQQCDNISLLAKCVVKKQRENTEEIGTASSLHTKCVTILWEDIKIAS